MLAFRRFCTALLVFVPLAAFQTPALAITQQQWTNVCRNSWGLRSAATQVDTNGAAYGMDDGSDAIACFQAPPQDWDTRLTDTITFITGFPNADGNYLIILRPCHGSGERYWDNRTFPKCSKAGNTIIAATPQTMGNYTVPQLVQWVMNNLP